MTTEKMTAFPHNDKQKYLDRLFAHRKADELVRGTGWESNGKTRGCAIGCALDKYDHNAYAESLGVPHPLPRLIDWLFENMPEDEAIGEPGTSWPERVLSAIAPGADLQYVYFAWAGRMLTRCIGYCGAGDEPWRVRCRTAIDGVRDYFLRLEIPTAADAAYAAAGAADAAAEINLQASDLLELLANPPTK